MAGEIELTPAGRELTGYFAGSVIIAIRDTADDQAAQRKLLVERFAQYFERLGEWDLRRMVRTEWKPFVKTVVNSLPEKERQEVWNFLNANDVVLQRLRDFVVEMLKHMQRALDEHEKGKPKMAVVA